MKFVDEYRSAEIVGTLAAEIASATTGTWTIMEICGGQTHAIMRFGLDQLLPPELVLVHGPGCPVCVTPTSRIDAAIELAQRPGTVLCSFGDMLRVPGSRTDLQRARAAGAEVHVVYSPLDALALAESAPDKEVVFFGVGFETTAPANAMAVLEAHRRGVANFSLLVSHVLVPPAMEALLSADDNLVQGFLAAGHVCTIMGCSPYDAIVERFGVPVVVTGFEPADILEGILMCVRQLEEGRAEVENQYARSVRTEGNAPAQAAISEVFEVCEVAWRGLGDIPASGLRIRAKYAAHDADARFSLAGPAPSEAESVCISGAVLRGVRKPPDCPAFGVECTPETPLGAPMVSSEGACAAYFRYKPTAR